MINQGGYRDLVVGAPDDHPENISVEGGAELWADDLRAGAARQGFRALPFGAIFMTVGFKLWRWCARRQDSCIKASPAAIALLEYSGCLPLVLNCLERAQPCSVLCGLAVI